MAVKQLKIEGTILNPSEYAKLAVIKEKDIEEARKKFKAVTQVTIL